MPYETKLTFIPNSYLPFSQELSQELGSEKAREKAKEAYERGRHYVHIWQPSKETRWRFRIYKYGKPRADLINRAKKILASMQAPMSMLQKVGATTTDWGLWVAAKIKNKYSYTWEEFYFSEHRIPSSLKVKTIGPLWADVDPMSIIDMRIYDKAEQEYKNLGEYERRVVAEDWLDVFHNTTGEVEKIRDLLYNAIKSSPLGFQVLCPKCYQFNQAPEGAAVVKCQKCNEDIDVGNTRSTKPTLTYDNIKDYIKKNATRSFKALFAQSNNEYWISILGNGTKLYETEDSLLADIKKDIDAVTVQAIYEEAKEMLEKEMPSIEEIKNAVSEKFEEMEQEEEQEELALAANCEQVFKVIKSIDSKGFNKEADYLKTIMMNKGIEYVD